MSRPRIRTLKPDCWADESISPLTRDARLLFVVLVTFADDDGRFRDLPAQIIGHGYPEDHDVTARKITAWMDELETVGVLVRYEVDGKRYATFPNWHLHQRVNRWTRSGLPRCPPTTDRVIVRHKEDEPALNDHDTFTEDSVNDHGGLTEGSRPDREGSKEGNPQAPSGASDGSAPVDRIDQARARLQDTEIRDLFAYWQQACRHPDAKLTADRRRKVQARLRDGYTVEQIRTGIDGAARAPFVNEDGKRFDDLELICRTGSKLEDFINRTAVPIEPRGDGFGERLNSKAKATG